MSSRLASLAAVGVAAVALPGGGSGRDADVLAPFPRVAHLGRPHLDSQLVQVASTDRSQGGTAALSAARAQGLDVSGSRVRVVVEARPGHATGAGAAVAAAGGETIGAADGLVDALVPPGSLETLAAESAVARVRSPARPFAESVDEGVAATGADAWHTAGYGGSGVKVAVIDLGFYGYSSLLGSALPASVSTIDHCGGKLSASPASGGTEHGTAVAELVHQMAPGAQLFLICIDSEVGLAQAEQVAITNGVKVVDHSVGWVNTSRGDGTGAGGSPDATVADARAHGILWVNAAGDDAMTHWSGTFAPDAAHPDVNDFASGDLTNTVTIASGDEVCAYLKWDDWPLTSEDFDLGLVCANDNALVASSADDQSSGPLEPTESLCYTNSGPTQNFGIEIARYSVAGSPRLDLFVEGGSSLQYSTAAGSIVEPASSPNALAVGADCWQNGSPAFYSSQGPTITGLTKPDLVAPDSVSTVTYGDFASNPGCGASGFAGTSASSAQVAGAAAVLLGRTPTLTVAGLEGALEQTSLAADASLSSPDTTLGHGRLELGPTDPLTGLIVFAEFGSGLYTISPDGNGLAKLPGTSAQHYAAPAWSPDGTKIAYGSYRDGEGDGISTVTSSGTNDTVVIPGGIQPSWSPDGTKIAYLTYATGFPEIAVANSDGTNQTPLPGNGSGGWPAWSTDGTKIAYLAQEDVWIMNANGTGQTRLTSFGDVHAGTNSGVSWSPDGTKLAVARGGLTDDQVWVMDANGANGHFIGPVSPGMNIEAPDWSPDGKTIVFTDTFGGGSGGDLWTMTANGENAFKILDDPNGTPDGPSWKAGALQTPANSAAPSLGGLSGGAVVGETLEVGSGKWSPSAGESLTYAWSRCNAAGSSCVPVAGADSTYLVGAADLGSRLRATVTATNAAGSATADSATSEVVQVARPVATALPTISGTVVPGHALSVGSNGTWTGSPAFAYQWRRCAEDGGDCSNIGGATSPSYTATVADAGSTIRLEVVGTNAGGQTFAASAAALSVPSAPAGVTAVAGDGQATIGFPPASSGGSPVASYTATASPGGLTATGAGSPLTVTGLTNGISYTFTVTATNAVGTGPASSPSNPVVPAHPDFSVAIAPSSQSVTQGQSATFNITLTSLGFSGRVTTSVIAAPPATTGSFSSSGPLALTVTTSSSTPPGSYPVTIQVANDAGTLVHTASATLVVTAAAFTLTVTKSGAGSGTVTSSVGAINCGATCAGDFDVGTSVTLTATAASGSTFAGWSGACTGLATCIVAMDAAKSVTATFVTKASPPVVVKCVVPKVTGKLLATAKRKIAAGHCRTGRTTKAKSKSVAKGRVISQSPRAGKKLARGTKVNLVVSRGKR
jgi:Subtilase family/PASTA domain/Divergent InlB B-repeat domain/Fibronectin type III domain/WD40-like Beta Propeller Repeat